MNIDFGLGGLNGDGGEILDLACCLGSPLDASLHVEDWVACFACSKAC